MPSGMKDFRDSCVLITGAARGVGAGFARIFQREGARLILVDIDGTALSETFGKLIGNDRARHRAYVVDLSDHEQREKLLRDIGAEGIDVDVLVNNTGIGYRSDLVVTPWKTLQKIID